MDIYEQQGQDITASDMVMPEEDSDIRDFYKGSSIFITGATGFLGKLAVEKLLRTCPDLKKIFILIREKKGKDVKQRYEEIFNEPTFDYLKRHNPTFKEKIQTVIGDVGLPDLGLNDIDRYTLVQEVDCVLHYAATVRFDEKLRLATYINVRGVRDLIRLAKEMKHLRAFLHVSTAFSNCTHKEIDEKFYEPLITGEKLLNLVECLDDDQLDQITKTVLRDFPNTYAFTKCVAEDIVRKEATNIPIALYRPSIVIATVKEPVSGWIDNIYGATGVLIGAAVGLLRSLYGKKENYAEMVPADYVINSCLAAMWETATIKSMNDNKEIEDKESKYEREIPVYNYVSTPQNPLTWDEFYTLSSKHAKQIPSEKVVWHHMFKMRSNYYEHMLAVFFLHTIPSYLVDFVLLCLRKKPMLVKGYQKINKFADVLAYFTLNQWKFKNDNVQSLWKKMKKHDKELFDFNIEALNWDMYFYTYTRGARVYLLKDPLDTIPQGTVKYYKLMFLHYTFLSLFWFLVFKFFMTAFNALLGAL
ncbi:fatty acyl-CoA reductase wat-like [Anthonomus grandis grandis]|uniref:fatty acyl-CoA reductase wat-like n=1 Tax=Anthonomus grandis grandis TaxID=2921223 RepID=UPI00216646D3|nr:fatty acyl-CoA reductase wat-like [Anthonomus grandis grandis]XP_050308706.1 fatty acyl-CoA reductase wat-like [Anthonomus grandis grandis]